MINMEQDLDIKNITGISEENAARKLDEEGFNELPSQKSRVFLPF